MKKETIVTKVSGRKRLYIGLVCAFLIILALHSYADNPLVTSVYTADPSGFVANGRLYVICSHDKAGATDYNQLYDYILLSSADLATWQNHGTVFDARYDTSWANLAYAPDMAVRNGKYYLYFPDGGDSIGVAVGNSPEGPFTDPIGRSLVNKSMPNCNVQWCFDPRIFVDDDGQVYLYFGGGGPGNARVIRLNSDMISVNGSAVTIDAPNFFEAAYMHKRNGIYYFSYSTDSSAGMRIDYMTSSNPMSGFQHRGTVLDNPWDNLGNNNHHSIVEYEGQWYIFYHNRTLSNSVYQRSVCLDYLYYNSDGTIQKVNATRQGVDPITNTSPPTPEPTPDSTPSPTPVVNGNIVVRARGTIGGEILEVHADGAIVGTWTMSTSYQDFYANGTGIIEVHFTNDDEQQNGMDIQVDYIVYNDSTYQAEDQEINTAVYIDGSCGGSYSEMLQCNGYIRFDTGGNNGTLGDVNNDGAIDIVDALLTAQYYVGLDPSNFDEGNADVNCDGSIDIVDALLVAQYYVGLVSEFCL
ncbi:MAG: family 43 glycosylhydrolase [Spirochaetales bacterium]|nr:family 43 glycosylhydrolase [Spirochaetales bacterium]